MTTMFRHSRARLRTDLFRRDQSGPEQHRKFFVYGSLAVLALVLASAAVWLK